MCFKTRRQNRVRSEALNYGRIAHKGSDEKETTQLVRVDGAMQFVQLIAKLKETFDELVTFRHTLAGGEPVTVSSEADFDDFCVLVQKMESEEPSTDLTPATAGKKERQKAVAVSSAPFKGGAKLIATPIDPSKLAKMVEMEELCITRPVDLEIAIKGQRCKGDSPININDGRWHHIALTWQSRGGQLIMYVDGNVRLSKTGVLQDARLSTGGCIAFGQSQSSIAKDFKKGSAFQGQVAQVSIWKKILPRSRVLRSMSLPMTGNEDGLVFLWDFAVDPVSGGGQIFNSSSYVQSAGSSAVSSVKGQIRDRAALWWGDATLPGEARTCGLGNPNDKSAYVRINVSPHQSSISALLQYHHFDF